MAFFHRYPYSDFHELNLDWIISEMKTLQDQMDGLLEEAIRQATANAIAYIDVKLADIQARFNEVLLHFNTLSAEVSALNATVEAFTRNFNSQIDALKTYIDDGLHAQTLQTQLLIAQNNEYLLAEMEQYLTQIKVINYFTGERVTIQDMFNYLATLHLNDAIDYDTMAYRALTYSYLASLNINYTNLAMHGNTLYI